VVFHLAAWSQALFAGHVNVGRILRRPGTIWRAANEETCWELSAKGPILTHRPQLEAAMPIFEQTGAAFIPVVHAETRIAAELLARCSMSMPSRPIDAPMAKKRRRRTFFEIVLLFSTSRSCEILIVVKYEIG